MTYQKDISNVNLLESFYYIQNWQIPIIHKFKSFMLDSGAFSFMKNKNIKIDWDSYIDKYIEFININNVNLFFELDIDCIVGYDSVVKYRNKIEKQTNKRTIPVWHRNRGKDNLMALSKEYDYIAIGGLAIKNIKSSEHKYINKLVEIIHNNNCKVHGLGFNKLNLKEYNFDSVDSTTWVYGNRAGFMFKYNGQEMTKIHPKKNEKIKPRNIAINNFWEWVKYSQAMRSHQIYLAGAYSRKYVIVENL